MIYNMNTAAPKRLPTLSSSYPASASIAAGESVTLQIVIQKDGRPDDYTYQWYLDGAAVSGALSASYTWTAAKTDGGTHYFYCMVTNKAGSVNSRTATVSVDDSAFRTPSFTYTGDYSMTDDSGNAVTPGSLVDNWKLAFLTSGTLNVTALGNAANGIDVFCLGGGGGGSGAFWSSNDDGYGGNGGGGGGGGYGTTSNGISLVTGNSNIVVGAGGSGGAGGASGTGSWAEAGGAGGTSSAFGVSAAGGGGGRSHTGSDNVYPYNGGTGSSSGGSGGASNKNGIAGGAGTVLEFGTGAVYAGGGGGGGGGFYASYGANAYAGGAGGNPGGGSGGAWGVGGNGTANTGGGGGGGGAPQGKTSYAGGSGGSGIVIIRNKR